MDKFDAMETFVAIVDEGILTKAAHQLGKAQTTVVRSLAILEEALGVRLLNRTTRRMSLTAEGHTYLEHCRQILSDVNHAEAVLQKDSLELRGKIRMTAPVFFGQLRVYPIIAQFVAEHPAVDIELVLLDRVVNLIEEGFDLAIRIAQLADSGLVATKVDEIRPVIVASPKLLRARGRPTKPEHLSGFPAVILTRTEAAETWTLTAHGRLSKVQVRSTFRTNLAQAAVLACEDGLGVGRFLSYQVQAGLDAGRLVKILEQCEFDAIPVHVIYAHARLVSARQRALVSFLKRGLSEARC